MTLESIEKLRELAADMNAGEIVDHMKLYPSCVFDGQWLDSWHVEFDRLLSEIQAEIDSRFMELPVDADGVPIHCGEELETAYGAKVIVEYVGECEIRVYRDGEHYRISQDEYVYTCRHVKPRTVEDVLEEALNKAASIDRYEGYWPSAADITNIVNEYAAELRMAGDAE